jgi:protein involved in polysaccharide export with SLBB domain
VLERIQVRELSEKTRLEMIRQVESTPPSLKPGIATPQEQQSLLQSMQQQQQQVLASLRSHPASGRLVIRISADLSKWENTDADIEMRAGDVLTIPKRPGFVMVSGQVYNSAAISYARGKDAEWYLKQAGGITQVGNQKAIYIVRANGAIVSHGNGWFDGGVLNVPLQPGDSVVVPEKLLGGSQFWRNLMTTAQLASSVAITGAVAGVF